MQKRPDITLRELREELGVSLSLQTLSVALRTLKYSFKKSFMRPNRIAPMWLRGMPSSDSLKDGRDHNINGYSIFLAGGGIRGDMTFGTTNDFREAVAENPATIHDIRDTIL